MAKNPTLGKTISWLAVSFILIAGTAYYEAGSWSIALWAAFWACLIKTPVYSFHEWLWGRIIFKEHETDNPIIFLEEVIGDAVEVVEEAVEAV